MAQRQSPQGHHEGRGSSRQGPQSRASEYRGQPSRERGQHREESYEFGDREGSSSRAAFERSQGRSRSQDDYDRQRYEAGRGGYGPESPERARHESRGAAGDYGRGGETAEERGSRAQRDSEDISSSNAWYSGYRGSDYRDYSESAQGYSGPHRDLQRSYGGQHRDSTQGGYGGQRRDQSAQGQSRFGSQDSSSNFYGPSGGPGYGGYGPQGSYGHGGYGHQGSGSGLQGGPGGYGSQGGQGHAGSGQLASQEQQSGYGHLGGYYRGPGSQSTRGAQGSYGHGPSHREYSGPGSQSGYAGSQRDFADWSQRSGWNPGGFSQEHGPGGAEPGSAHKRSRGPKGYKRSDERIREDVCERLGSQEEVDASEVEVQVQDGQVTLTGTVTHQRDKRHLEDLAEAVPGVQEVIIQLRVHRADQQRGSSGATATTADKSSATDQHQRSESAAGQGAPAPPERPATKASSKRASA